MRVASTTPRPEPVERALRFVRDPASDRFPDVALSVFAFQFERCEPYRRLCARRGLVPGRVTRWEEIPPVPTAAFRDLVLSCGPATRVFRTSGTTGLSRGAHHLPELALYDAAWEAPFRRHVRGDLPGRVRVLSLIQSERAAPESSLSYMASRIVERCGSAESRWLLESAGDIVPARAALSEGTAAGVPVVVLGTALAFHAVLEGLTVRLPAGSRIMDTGGFKGRRREMGREEMLRLYEKALGVPASCVVGEYGMTELSSQFYETGDRTWEGPPWVRTRVLDPETLEEVPSGRTGLLAHLDLANAWTVAGVLTEDLGVAAPGGFRLLGRAPGSALRGCSLATEEMLDS